jgi:solute carrier family 9B (sodium/hydrogen exchanger), member 1/2
MEGFTIALVAHIGLKLPLVEAGMLGFIVAAVSPAVVVPSMLSLKEKGLGTKQGVPVIVLAGASVDDVFAITLFTVFLGLATQGDQPIVWQIAQIPLRIAGGVLLGAILGWLLYRLYRRFHLSNLAKLGTAMAAALAALLIGEQYQLAGLLGVMTLGFVLLEKANGIAVTLERGLNQIWFFAQIFLFVLIGAQVNLSVAWQAGLMGLTIIGAGVLARTLGVMIALYRSHLSLRERLFCAIAYMPKATVQAAIGGIPLAMGIESGETILAIAVLAVVITASLGATGIQFSAPRLLERDDAMTKGEVSETAPQPSLKRTRVEKEYG